MSANVPERRNSQEIYPPNFPGFCITSTPKNYVKDWLAGLFLEFLAITLHTSRVEAQDLGVGIEAHKPT